MGLLIIISVQEEIDWSIVIFFEINRIVFLDDCFYFLAYNL